MFSLWLEFAALLPPRAIRQAGSAWNPAAVTYSFGSAVGSCCVCGVWCL